MPEYNGWTNYETWCVNLWLDNDEGTYRMIRGWGDEIVTDLLDAMELDDDTLENADYSTLSDDDKHEACMQLEKRIEEYVDDGNPLGDDAGLYSDLISASLREVNYYEIAEYVFAE